jgi:branched-subunit amino acid aminotransferase/4-amino-4-deoxychorismate lyase
MSSFIYLNGKFINEAPPTISAKDRGLQLGDGVFDTLLVLEGRPQDAQLHFARLARHAAQLQIPFPSQSLEEIAQQIVRHNNLAAAPRCALRTTLTRGPAERGLAPPESAQPTLLMQIGAAPDPASLPPATAIICRATRRNEYSPLSRIKSLNYADSVIAILEAKERGASEAILLNTKGDAACAAASNIFIREGAHFYTPRFEDGAIDGVTRAKTLEFFDVRETAISEERLLRADAVFLTNSILGIRHVRRLEDRIFAEENMEPALKPPRANATA